MPSRQEAGPEKSLPPWPAGAQCSKCTGLSRDLEAGRAPGSFAVLLVAMDRCPGNSWPLGSSPGNRAETVPALLRCCPRHSRPFPTPAWLLGRTTTLGAMVGISRKETLGVGGKGCCGGQETSSKLSCPQPAFLFSTLRDGGWNVLSCQNPHCYLLLVELSSKI